MEGGQQSHSDQEQARLADQPVHRPAPVSRRVLTDDDLQPRPPAPVGTWLSTTGRTNHDARSVWAAGDRGASQVELERSLRMAVKAHRDAEIRLQLELQKRVELSGTASRMMAERELLSAQVEDIRGRLLEAKLQNIKLKNELSSRAARDSLGCRTCNERCLCCRGNRSKQNATARGRPNLHGQFRLSAGMLLRVRHGRNGWGNDDCVCVDDGTLTNAEDTRTRTA